MQYQDAPCGASFFDLSFTAGLAYTRTLLTYRSIDMAGIFDQTPVSLPADLRETVARALEEDIGSGDLTAALIPNTTQARATVISRETAVICGTAWFDEVFALVEPRVEITWQVRDGDLVSPDQVLCTLRGPARGLLTGERTALNFLQTLSGTATRAHRYAEAVAGTGVHVLDTRKTLPGLRSAQKYAVRCGGCYNHRMGLYDAVQITAGRAKLEASGGFNLGTLRAVAETGVDYISAGDITKDVKAVDLSMRFVAQPAAFISSRTMASTL